MPIPSRLLSTVSNVMPTPDPTAARSVTAAEADADADADAATMQDIQFPLAQSGSRPKQMLRVAAGLLLGLLRPGRRQALLDGRPGRERLALVDRLLIAALVWQHRRRSDLGALSGLHRWLWQGEQAERVHAQAEARFENWWLPRHSAIVAPLQAALADAAASGRPITTLCEIGCGTGRVLADLAERLPPSIRLLGLDLSPGQIAANRERHAAMADRLRFEAADATPWLAAHGAPCWAYLANGGVLEYFSEAMLEALLRGIAEQQSPAVIALVEPLPDDYDLDRETASRPYNAELSLGHNYPLWLRRCGWRLRYRERQDVGGVRWLLVVADVGLG